MGRPHKIVDRYTDDVNRLADKLMKHVGESMVSDDGTRTRIYVCDQRAGYYSPTRHVIVIPRWAWVKANDYRTWYVAHELSHLLVNRYYDRSKVSTHGPEFMQELKRVCPKYCQKYEHDYKPRNAKAAGISQS